ncbi:myosin vii xv [Holotrichia oblita]|uniref:Myosin vii xv n=1 Tax=Holotrichia oblita TaxID=644536 RepID=A0ACB9TD54_HOLOL|nr:myosin vii xv [Holotrichia oblita]
MTNLDNLVVGDYIWIHPTTAGEFDVPSGGKILAIEAKRLRIKSDTGSEIYIGKEQVFKPIHISSIKIVEDMINLGDLQEYSILRNLHIRYLDKLIYTYTGTMLVAINPYEVLPIYTNAIIKEYKDNKLGELPPHIFAIGDSAYNEMKTMSKDQCVVISGESGAGKTESTKLILQYLASTSGKHSWIEQQILEANPILEAFGNAKTVRNDNSSRFGKYIDINFNKNGQIEGAKIDQYLLEKESYRFAKRRNEVSEFGEIREAFKILNFSEKEVSDVFQLLACILHFGNLKFKKTIVANMEASEIAEPTAVSKIAVFLGTNKFDLSEALTKRTIFVHGEKVVTNLSDTQAYEARDAFVKGIYGKLFIAIVEKLNSVIYQPKVSRKTSIGVLDIFGFENFGVNSFEQLCINYANENLQQFFVQHIFKLEQDYYTKEGINWKHIVFVDNQEILDMIGTKSMNILSLIDEESKFPKGTDFTMLAKLNNTHGRKSNYLQSKSNLEPLFGIKHFAGSVHYHVPDFLEKNRDSFSQDLKQLIQQSSNDYLKKIFDAEFKDEVKGKKTLSSQFRFSLEALMRTLNACHPYFIRCIKPNENKRPLEFDRALCCRQLRYSGMMETAKIRQAGYPIRHDYFNFVNRFRYLAPNILPAHKGNPRESARSICQAVFKNNEDYQLVKLRNVEERELKKAGNKNYKHAAEVNMQKRLAEINRAYIVKQKLKPDEPQPNELVDNLFDFLKDNEVAPSSTDIKESEEFLNQLNKKSRETEEETEEREDLSAYNFNKFAATYFRKNVNPAYSKKPLKESLLELPTPDDVIAAQALWITILRFTGDLPEPRYESETKVITENDTIMSKVTETLSRSFTNRKEFQEILRQEQAYSKYSKAERQKYISMTLKRKSKLLDDVRHGMVEDRFANEMYREWIHDKRTTNLEKLHFIIGHGILRQELRDEIFCQICKILTANPTKASHARGWILLSLCVGCFPPSERLVLYLKAFMRSGPPGYAPYCEGRLNRTFKNGARTQPPSWLELHATKNKQPINLQITFMDKTTVTIEADSATTSAEVCENIAMNLNLTDTFGFSLFITLYDKVMSLGSDNDHIMDAISQCEQYAKEQGKQERSAPWKLFYRKEIFTPWHDPAADAVATNLIYHQIIRGLKFGEYRCPNEGDVATLVAQQYYIENGPVIQPKVLHTRIGEYTPTYMVQKGEYSEEWEKKIIDSFNRSTCVKETKPALRAKEDIVKYGKLVWPILFSKFYEAIKISGPELPKDNMIIAINWTGIYMIDDQEQILMEMTFADVAYVNYQQNAQFQLHNITFSTIRNEEYVFQSPDAENMYNLIIYLIDGLKERSVYVVAMQDYKHPGEAASFLSYKKGDLIVLKNGFTGSDLKSSAWGNGECNGRVGDFITEHVYILPTLYKPPADILQAFKKDGAFEARQPTAPVISTIRRMKVHTLAQYANDHFRSSRRLTVNKTSVLNTVRRASKEELWKYTNQPVYQPLLQKVLEDSNLSKQAVEAFTAILKYMGDMPAPKSKICNELTDVIFAGCFSHDLLKDEIYCQIMRQLTYNRLSSSEEKGWELLYLATGLFSCSPSLMSDLTKFIQSRVHPFVEPCLQRLQRSSKIGARKYPPYSVEVDAIQHRSLQIYHKVYFPDDNDEAFEVDSLTKASDLCKAIAERLGLNSYDGFSLMVMITDKVFSIPDNYYFYDFLHELIDWVKESKPSWNSGAPVQAQYQVFFMKKLWINTIPGRDLAADHIFHYHQEMPKYIRGYHKCSKLDAVKLAALILRVRHKARTNEAFESLTHEKEIREVVPIDLFKAQSMSEWKKQITVAYNTDGKMTELEAKSKFLEVIYQWPTFGSTFFEVKQSSEPSHPEIILIAINKNGVNVIHPQTKDILVTHDFSELTNWSSGNTYFHITVGNAMRRLKYLYETAQGYKMDDLITSYVDFISNTTKKDNKPFIF